MNIFFLDSDLEKCAQYHADRHIKMALEACQMLASAYPQGVAPYKHTHINHPMTKWARETRSNFIFTAQYALSLCREYSFRYNDKKHKCERVAKWYLDNVPDFTLTDRTDPPRCFDDFQIKLTNSVVEDYRNYYLMAKRHLFNWKNRPTPEWIS